MMKIVDIVFKNVLMVIQYKMDINVLYLNVVVIYKTDNVLISVILIIIHIQLTDGV